MGKYTVGPLTRKGAGSSIKMASPDDPIYTRGFSVGEMHSTSSSKNTQAKVLPLKREKQLNEQVSEESSEYDTSTDEVLSRVYHNAIVRLAEKLIQDGQARLVSSESVIRDQRAQGLMDDTPAKVSPGPKDDDSK